MSNIKGWKTIVLAGLVALLSWLSGPEMKTFVAENFEAAGTILAVAIAGLRALTTSPIFQK